MDPNTHSAFIVRDNISMFIDGIPDECDHRWDGATVHTTESGKKIYWHTFRRWSTFTSQCRDALIVERQHQEGDPVTMQAVTCSKCGKEFHPPLF